MRTTPLPLMVVTRVPLELLDVNVKEGLVVGVKRVFQGGVQGIWCA